MMYIGFEGEFNNSHLIRINDTYMFKYMHLIRINDTYINKCDNLSTKHFLVMLMSNLMFLLTKMLSLASELLQ